MKRNAVVLDTSVVSLLHPANRETQIREHYKAEIQGKHWVVSFQSVAELYRWADERHWGQYRRDDLDGLLDRMTVVESSRSLSKCWAEVMVATKRTGSRLEVDDAWIAATAIYLGIPLVTHDKDLARLNIPKLKVVSFVDLD